MDTSPDPIGMEYKIKGVSKPFFELFWRFRGDIDKVKIYMSNWSQNLLNDYQKYILTEFYSTPECKALRRVLPHAPGWLCSPENLSGGMELAWDRDDSYNVLWTVPITSPLKEIIVNDEQYQTVCLALGLEQIFWHETGDPPPKQTILDYRECAIGTTDIYDLMFHASEAEARRTIMYVDHFLDLIPDEIIDGEPDAHQ